MSKREPRPPACHDTKSITELIEIADGLAQASGSRLTPIRQRVYEILLEAGAPLSAYDIIPLLKGTASPKPVTAYRALDWLEELGLIRKVRSVSRYVALAGGPSREPTVFAVCKDCGAVEEMETGGFASSLLSSAETMGFEDQASVIEIVSVCSDHRGLKRAQK